MSKAQTLKSIVKKDPNPSFGSDPSDPWATRSNMMNETALLNKYLKSRGINPNFASKDIKVAHSKTNAFKAWLSAHQDDPVREETLTTKHTPTAKRGHELRRSIHAQSEIRVPGSTKKLHTEAVDKKDTVTFDIPLLIRVLEFAREDLKSDVLLHKMVERLINLRRKGTLTMNQYGKIVKEEVEQLDELQKSTLLSYASKAREKAETLTKQGDRAKKISTKYSKYKKAAMRYAGASKAEKKSITSEDTFQDTYAATQTSFDGGNSPAEEPTTTSNKKRIIKDVYKKKRGLKEDLYDHEKEDKSVAGYGKKPKVQKETTGKLKAAAVLSGGTTLTGQKRDTVEIDPMMKMKPGQKQKEEVR